MNNDKKLEIVNAIIKVEGGYSDHPADNGGPTRYGITLAVARANSYSGDMRELPLALAQDIYIKRYISEPRFDSVYDICDMIGAELIDTGVNMGPATASMFFQRILNAMNAQGSRYADIFVDGRIGNITLACFSTYINWRKEEGATVFYKALQHIQGSRYLDIAEKNASQESFFYGWIKERT